MQNNISLKEQYVAMVHVKMNFNVQILSWSYGQYIKKIKPSETKTNKWKN